MRTAILAACLLTLTSGSALSENRFFAPGDLLEGSGIGVKSKAIFLPGIRFPLEEGPAFANSQFYGVGGQRGNAGDTCDKANFSYPWRDNFCEFRKADLPLCQAGGHQGQDIRPATCELNRYWAVAVDDGVIVQVGRFSVTLQNSAGTLYRYVHLGDVAVKELDKVSRGDRIGKVSNHWVGDLPMHLHFDVKDTVTVDGKAKPVFVPPYSSLVASYVELMDRPGGN
jgi:murein DD-endopeptidase MepM/ murein hydrolase activator NlpD